MRKKTFIQLLALFTVFLVASCQRHESSATVNDIGLYFQEELVALAEVTTGGVENTPVVELEVPEFQEIHVVHEFRTEPNRITRKTPPDFMQGLYVTAHRATSAGFNDFLIRAKEAGINTIVFDIKEMQGYVYFSIRNHPQLRFTYAEPILNINNVVAQIHSHGMYAVARIVQFYNIATATRHPYLQPRHRNGGFWQERPGQPRWVDSSHPLVQAEMLQIIDIVAASNVDEIQLDYIRFPTEGRLSDAVFYFEQIDALRLAEDSSYIRREK